MDRRRQFQELLETLTDDVHFQPGNNVTLEFPCITYERSEAETAYADDRPYRRTKRYQVTVIDRKPDSDLPDKVADLPYCVFTRHFVTDNLHHDVFLIYF